MDYHHHARLTIVRREELARKVVEGRLSLKEAEFKLSRQSSAKWVRRYREAGVAGLRDRSSRPHRSTRRTSEERVVEMERLRRERWKSLTLLDYWRVTIPFHIDSYSETHRGYGCMQRDSVAEVSSVSKDAYKSVREDSCDEGRSLHQNCADDHCGLP